MNKLIGFDGIRAIACLMVIAHHITQRMNPLFMPDWLQPVWNFTIEGNIGVSVFFVLSGALLSYPFWRSFLNDEPMPSAKVYFIRRYARIAPGFYLSLTVTFICAVLVFDSVLNGQLITRYLAGIFLVGAFHHVTLFPTDVNGPLWSISFEVISYVFLFAVMFVLFKLLKKRSFSDALYYLGFILFLTILLHIVVYKFYPIINEGRGWQHGLIGGAILWMPGYNVFSLFSHFLFGIIGSALMTYLFHKKQESSNGFDYFIIFNWVAFIIYAYLQRGHTFINIPYYWPFFPMLIGITLVCLPFTTSIAKIIDNRFFAFTAKISFGLYVWHYLLMELIEHFIVDGYEVFGSENLTTFLMGSILTLVFSYIIATASFYLLERPVQKWSQRIK